MKSSIVRRSLPYSLGLIFLLAAVSACTRTEATPEATETGETAPTPTLMATEPPTPAPTDTPPAEAAEETEEPEPTVTSPVPTPTPPITPTPRSTPTPSPTPQPEPTFYTVQPGDSLIAIAEQYSVTVEALLYANGYASLEEAFLVAGDEWQIPLCEAHQVAAGNTLSGIAQLCDVGLDELATANIAALAPLGTLESVPVGFVLAIPEPGPAAAPDCAEEPGREQVIEYTPQEGEGIFCLAQKFALTTTTIVQANIERLSGGNVYGETPLLIPPANGAVYVVTEEDVENGITLAAIAEWYEIVPELIVDWNNNPVSEPLTEGQQLFVPGANLAFGVFQLQPPATPTPEATPEATVEG
ncbi:MAG: LysM peptidoglycan-binding domain-containing protein [Chloroflexi bacterium]|nr:LysM peptidoglycan-binding domain-containing protein [Chloroflexota bacterium]